MTTVLRTARLSAAESFWYLVGCIGFGMMYLAKVPVKKALAEAGLAEMTSAERFWYRVQCVALGAGYLAKIPVKKALNEAGPVHGGGRRGRSADGDGVITQLPRAIGSREDRPTETAHALSPGRHARPQDHAR
jgi:hypothetical protein